MKIHWKLFTDSSSAKSAEKVMLSSAKKLGLKPEQKEINSYHKGGFTCSFSTQLEIESWDQVPYIALKYAQLIGRQWIITGNIEFEFSAWSNDSSVPGITNIEVQVEQSA
jgi:hypothetical protein